MTGRELKKIIFLYLETKGWQNLRPGEYYAWNKPDPKSTDPNPLPQHYCWHAALVVEMANEEGKTAILPAAAFQVIEGGRR